MINTSLIYFQLGFCNLRFLFDNLRNDNQVIASSPPIKYELDDFFFIL